jgi:hypothetical protein
MDCVALETEMSDSSIHNEMKRDQLFVTQEKWHCLLQLQFDPNTVIVEGGTQTPSQSH